MDFGVERSVPLAERIPLSPNDANRGKSFGQGPAQRALGKADVVVAPPKRTNADTTDTSFVDACRRNLSLTSLRLTIHVVTLQRLLAAYRAWLSASLALRWRRALVLHSDRHVRRRTFRRWHSRTRAVAGDAVRRELADCSWRARRLRAAWRRADDHVRARHLDARVMARGRRFPLAGALARWRAGAPARRRTARWL